MQSLQQMSQTNSLKQMVPKDNTMIDENNSLLLSPDTMKIQQLNSQNQPNPGQKQNFIEHSEFKYPGICNLCHFKDHRTSDCPFACTFYHATNIKALESIIQNGIHPKKGRLGEAVYVSDNPKMCIQYSFNRFKKFSEPILLKLKVMISGTIKEIELPSEAKSIGGEFKRQQNVQAIKCPYFTNLNETLYQYALLEPYCVVVSWRPIKDEPDQPRNQTYDFSRTIKRKSFREMIIQKRKLAMQRPSGQEQRQQKRKKQMKKIQKMYRELKKIQDNISVSKKSISKEKNMSAMIDEFSLGQHNAISIAHESDQVIPEHLQFINKAFQLSQKVFQSYSFKQHLEEEDSNNQKQMPNAKTKMIEKSHKLHKLKKDQDEN